MEIKRGEIYFADLGTGQVGSEQSGTRPVLIVQNDIGNRFSPTVVVACITSKLFKNDIPTHVPLEGYGLVLCEQIKTIDKSRLLRRLGKLDANGEMRVNTALRLSLQI
ncbi:MAG: type II toxin-antitoxin system PemK/MazF family toxin [Firmicutes bacterium]|nr:type II toxin-antitoxin system PemK/MazF family toxin [Bacillota bacterium]